MADPRIRRAVISIGVIVLFAAVGHSMSRVADVPDGHATLVAAGGAGIAFIALLVGTIIGPGARAVENREPPNTFLGVKVAMGGFLLAMVGWLTAVYVHGVSGYFIAVAGVLVRFVGVGIHFFLIFRARRWL